MSYELAEKQCIPCRGGIPPLKGDDLTPLQNELGADWKTVEEHHIEKVFKFDTYREGIDFVNAVAEIAEEQQHHPDILLTYGKVRITIWTHAINGLTESDFIFAARTDRLLPTP